MEGRERNRLSVLSRLLMKKKINWKSYVHLLPPIEVFLSEKEAHEGYSCEGPCGSVLFFFSGLRGVRNANMEIGA